MRCDLVVSGGERRVLVHRLMCLSFAPRFVFPQTVHDLAHHLRRETRSAIHVPSTVAACVRACVLRFECSSTPLLGGLFIEYCCCCWLSVCCVVVVLLLLLLSTTNALPHGAYFHHLVTGGRFQKVR